MLTEQQLEANRRNAQLSTGPRTPEGKARSSQNALKHGIFAHNTLLPQEDADEYAEFSQALHDDLRPCGALEEVLVAQLISAAWRQKRIAHIEAGVFAEFLSKAQREWARIANINTAPNGQPYPELPPVAAWGHAFTYYNENGQLLERLTRYQTLVSREFYRTLKELRYAQQVPHTSQSEAEAHEEMPDPQNEAISLAEATDLQNEPISSLSLQPSAFTKNDPILAPDGGNDGQVSEVEDFSPRPSTPDPLPSDHQPTPLPGSACGEQRRTGEGRGVGPVESAGPADQNDPIAEEETPIKQNKPIVPANFKVSYF